MKQEVLLNSTRARSHKKFAYEVSPCANGKNESPIGGKYKSKLIYEKPTGLKKVSHFWLSILTYI